MKKSIAKTMFQPLILTHKLQEKVFCRQRSIQHKSMAAAGASATAPAVNKSLQLHQSEKVADQPPFHPEPQQQARVLPSDRELISYEKTCSETAYRTKGHKYLHRNSSTGTEDICTVTKEWLKKTPGPEVRVKCFVCILTCRYLLIKTGMLTLVLIPFISRKIL